MGEGGGVYPPLQANPWQTPGGPRLGGLAPAEGCWGLNLYAARHRLQSPNTKPLSDIARGAVRCDTDVPWDSVPEGSFVRHNPNLHNTGHD